MSKIDISKFAATFFEESLEHLADMEQALVELQVENPDNELIQRIFRAMHSIKGNAGIFSFDSIAIIPHVAESILEKARNNQVQISTEILDELLKAVDVIREQVLAAKSNKDFPSDQVQACKSKLEKILNENSTEISSSADEEEDGFGFFIDVENKLQKNNVKSEVEEDEGFGFFEPLPAKNEKPETVVEKKQEQANPTKISQKDPVKDGKEKESSSSETTSIRVDLKKVDYLINLVGELVITEAMLTQLAEEVDSNETLGLKNGIKQLNRNMRELQEGIMSIRMVPVSFIFHRFFRIIRDLSSKLGKKLKLELEGENTELDKGLIEKIADPIMHMIRNSADHGIESPEERLQAGKPEEGVIKLKAYHHGGNIVIEISDDGAGLNKTKILEKAKRENIVSDDEELSDQEIYRLIFAPGFSTASEVTEISGRGVGMDVVVKNIRSLGGSVDVVAEEGRGSTFFLKLPLTLAILDGLITKIGDQIYIVPLTHVVESLNPDPENIKKLSNGAEVIEFRDEFIPIVHVHKLFNIQQNETKDDLLIIVENDHKKYALNIDHLLGQSQIVIKNLETNYKRIEGISGATIMGDGKVALIMDIASLIRMNFKK